MLYIIAGKFKKRALFTPKSSQVRPTTAQFRETFFNICQHTIEEARFLDLFAGSGAMGLEALSRGARHATFVEKERTVASVIRRNIETLQVEELTTLYVLDALRALKLLYKQHKVFECIYADPPYAEGFGTPLLQFLDTHPLLTPGGSLFIEESSLQEPPLTQLSLYQKREVGKAHLFEYRSRES